MLSTLQNELSGLYDRLSREPRGYDRDCLLRAIVTVETSINEIQKVQAYIVL